MLRLLQVSSGSDRHIWTATSVAACVPADKNSSRSFSPSHSRAPAFSSARTHAIWSWPGADFQTSRCRPLLPSLNASFTAEQIALRRTRIHIYVYVAPLCRLLTWAVHNVCLPRVSLDLIVSGVGLSPTVKLDLTRSHNDRATTCAKVTGGLNEGIEERHKMWFWGRRPCTNLYRNDWLKSNWIDD